MNQELIDKLDSLIELSQKQINTAIEMRRLAMLADVLELPIGQVKGKVSYSLHSYGRPLYSKPWRHDELVVKVDGEERARKKLVDVPTNLWPDEVRQEYERMQRRRRKP